MRLRQCAETANSQLLIACLHMHAYLEELEGFDDLLWGVCAVHHDSKSDIYNALINPESIERTRSLA